MNEANVVCRFVRLWDVTEKQILAEKRQASQLLEAIVSLAYGVYVVLSKRFAMTIDVELGKVQ